MGDMLAFKCGSEGEDTFKVRQVEGTEEISGLYRFELEMFSEKDSIDPASVLMKGATLQIGSPIRLGAGSGGAAAKILGMISSFEQLEKVDKWVRYRAVLSPRLWKLTLARNNRIFLKKKVDDLVSDLLQGAGMSPEISIATRPVREYTAQYRESDFDFLSRWLEHEGILYFFKHEGEDETAVFADNTAAHPDIGGDPVVEFEQDVAASAVVGKSGKAEGAVTSFSLRARPLPREVVLRDWDADLVSEVSASAQVDSEGFGKVTEYGFNPKDAGHANLLAKARAEAIKCRGRVFFGTGRCRFFRAGAKFRLENHYSFDGSYVITRVSHRMTQPLGIPRLKDFPHAYENDFQCVPDSVPFRPERVTPWPRIHGFSDALVTSGKDKPDANVDEKGSYNLQMMYDKDADGKVSQGNHPVRMAQPYAGDSYGMHFPLHADNEVIVGHKDGDPDRPVIISAVPNPKKKSPVVGENTTQCMIKTGAGNMIRMEDKGGGEDFYTYAKKDKDTRVEQDDKKFVGQDKHTIVKRDKIEKVEGERNETVEKNHVEQVKGDRFLTVKGKQATEIGSGGLSLTIQGPLVEALQQDHSEDTKGNYFLKAMSVVIEASTGITLKAGGGTVVIDPVGVTLKGNIVTVDGSLAKIASGPGSSPKSGSAGSKIKPSTPKDPKEAVK